MEPHLRSDSWTSATGGGHGTSPPRNSKICSHAVESRIILKARTLLKKPRNRRSLFGPKLPLSVKISRSISGAPLSFSGQTSHGEWR